MVLCPKQKTLEFEARMKKNLGGKMREPVDYDSCDYRHVGVLRKCTEYHVDTDGHQDVGRGNHDMPNKKHRKDSSGNNKNDRPFFDLSSPANTDRYRQMSKGDFDNLGIVRPLPTMLFQGSMLSHLSSAPMTKFLFDRDFVVHSMIGIGSTTRAVPRLHEVPVKNSIDPENEDDTPTVGVVLKFRHPIPGDRYKLSHICLHAGMHHTRRAHPMLCPDDDTHTPIIIITRAYKNDWRSVQAHLVALDAWREDQTKPLYNDTFDGKLTVYGSGGAPEILGTHPPDYKRDTKFDPQVHIPAAQPFDSSKINKALMKLAFENKCVAIYVNQDEMFASGGEEASTVEPSCRFLGYFFCATLVVESLPAPAVHERFKNTTQEMQINAQYLQVPHLRLNLEPIFNNNDLQKMRKVSDIANAYKILAVDHNCTDQMIVDIPFGGAEAALAVLDRSQMYRSFIENKDYLRYLKTGPANRKYDDDDDLGETRQSRATIRQLVDACLINNAAGAFRAMKTNIREEVAGPLMIESLPVICRLQATPMSNRALDVVCLFLRRDCKETGLFQRTNTAEGCRIAYTKELESDLVDLAFKVILLRFTGRINAFRNYSLHKNTSGMIPSVGDLGEFLDFMKQTVKQETSERIGRWHSKQHLQAIPESVQRYETFAEFIGLVGAALPAVIADVLKKQVLGERSRDTRKEAVGALKVMLSSCCCNGDTSAGLHFLAQLIVADVDEIFEDVFGETHCAGMIAGHGGKAGVTLLGDKFWRTGLPEILKQIVKYVQTEVSEEHLAIAGYRKDDKGVVVNCMNGRPFNASDAEHFLCKGSVLAKLTLGHYRNSKYPLSAKPWCHPMKLTRVVQPYDAFTTGIMETIVKSYSTCVSADPCLLTVPEVCILPGEKFA